MHIAIVTKELGAGGAERVIVQLLSEWVKLNVQCSLILLDKSRKFYEVPQEINLYEIGELSSRYYIDKIKKYLEVRRIIKRIDPDIVLSLPEEYGIYVIGAMLGSGKCVIVSERNNPWLMPNKKITRFLRKILYPFGSGFIFQSEKAKSFFSRKIQRKSTVLPNPVDVKRLPEPFGGEREKIIVSAGRFEKQKNHKLLVDAFALFFSNHHDYKLIIYGDGTLRNETERYAESLLPKGSYLFPGKVCDLCDRIKSATCFVMTSNFEGMPNALLEAMACGLPVITTDYEPGTASDFITNHENGIIVPRNDAEQIKNEIEFIVLNEDAARNLSKNAIRIKKELDSQIVAQRWLTYIDTVWKAKNK